MNEFFSKSYKPFCYQSGKCFAKKNNQCTILTRTMTKFPCPFMKEKRENTNGNVYPLDERYGKEF